MASDGKIYFSEKQNKKALSSKKSKKNIKYVVAKPFYSFWPQLEDEYNETFNQLLSKSLPRIKHSKLKISYKTIAKIPKEERKKFRSEYYLKNSKETVNKKDDIVFGINEVTKCLEKQDCCAVAIAHDVSPKLMVEHILDMCVLYNIPVIITKDLRETLKESCGLTSVIMGFKKNTASQNLLNIINSIISLKELYPPPINHINYQRSIQVDNSINTNINREKPIKSNNSIQISTKYHLKKISDSEKAFVPVCKEDKSKKEDDLNFISFGNVEESHISTSQSYIPLVVKGIRPNKNREEQKRMQ